jgi:gas vesicle protein
MYYDEESGAVNFLAGLLMGAVLGATLALLAAPQSGKKTRRRLMRAVSSARGTAEDRWGDLTEEMRSAVDAGRKRIRV